MIPPNKKVSPNLVQEHRVFEDAYLAARNGDVERTNSHYVRCSGNRVVIMGQVRQAGGPSPILTLQLEGSYDGLAWNVVGSAVTLDAASNRLVEASSSPIACDRPFVRLRATLSTGNSLNRVLFDAVLVTSHQ